MKMLPDEFEKWGRKFTIVETTDNFRIWKVEAYGTFWYEGHFRKYQKEQTLKLGDAEVFYEAKETFPGDEQFGKWAWTSKSLNSLRIILEQKYSELLDLRASRAASRIARKADQPLGDLLVPSEASDAF